MLEIEDILKNNEGTFIEMTELIVNLTYEYLLQSMEGASPFCIEHWVYDNLYERFEIEEEDFLASIRSKIREID